MSGSEPLFPFAWGALRLVSSLLTASFKKKLVGVEEERTRAMGDVVLKARDKSRRTKQQGRGDGDAAMRAVEQHGHETRRSLDELGGELGVFGEAAKAERHVTHSELLGAMRDAANARDATTAQLAGVGRQVHGVGSDIADARKATTAQLAGVAQQKHGVKDDVASSREATMAQLKGARSEVADVKRDLASVSASVDACRSENEQFFRSFTQGLEATHLGIETLMSAPLKEAEMALKNFTARGVQVEFLDEARRKAMKAVVQGHTVDVKLSAAVIAVSAGYVSLLSEEQSPLEAKQFTVSGTLVNIVDILAPLCVDPSLGTSADGPKVLEFLLNLVSCVCALPPVAQPVLSDLDERLLPAFGKLCATEPEIYHMYPEVGGVAVRALLASQTMRDLFELADEVDVDVTRCTSKYEVIQILLASGKALFRAPATGDKVMLESQTMLDLCLLARENDVNMDRCKPLVIKILLGSGKELKPTQDATTDRAALLALFTATNGPSWKTSTAWGTSASLGKWYGVTVDDDGRVSQLQLPDNRLSGAIPPELSRLTALTKLNLAKNNLTGPTPSALGGLAALQELYLYTNKLSGPIPSSLGGLTALQELSLYENHLTGAIPPELGGLTALTLLNLKANNLTGAIPPELGGLTKLTVLNLRSNNLTGSIPRELGQLKVLKNAGFFGNNFSGTKGDVQQLLPGCNVLWRSLSG